MTRKELTEICALANEELSSFPQRKQGSHGLLERESTKMSEEQKEAQRRSFAYGNVVLHNSNITKILIDLVAKELERRKKFVKQVGRRRIQRKIDWISQNGPCKDCGATTGLVVHNTANLKKPRSADYGISKIRLQNMLATCCVLCEECHIKRRRQHSFTNIKHGAYSTYTNRKCRCDLCKNACSMYQKNRRSQGY